MGEVVKGVEVGVKGVGEGFNPFDTEGGRGQQGVQYGGPKRAPPPSVRTNGGRRIPFFLLFVAKRALFMHTVKIYAGVFFFYGFIVIFVLPKLAF